MELNTVTLAEDLDKETVQMGLGVSFCWLQETWCLLIHSPVKIEVAWAKAGISPARKAVPKQAEVETAGKVT